MSDAAALAEAYFGAVRGRDPETLRGIFADDGELVTVAGTFRGPEEIARFYSELVFATSEHLDPHPGPFLIEGDRLAVEIELHRDGEVHGFADFFTIRDGKIERLVIYSGPSGP
jgi:ketosteroid isomerase-like protein